MRAKGNRPSIGRQSGDARAGGEHLRRTRPAILTSALALLLALATAVPSSAQAQRGLEVAFLDPRFSSADQGPAWLDRTKEIGADVIRVNVSWNAVARGASVAPANPSDHASAAYNFEGLDRVVRGASQRGMKVMFTVFDAPTYAEGAGRPANLVWKGTWKIQPARLAEFATALGRRYNGSFNPDGLGALPQIQYVTAWIEPNINVYLNPQWQGRKPFAAGHYRRMNNAFYDAIKKVNPRVHVLTGGTGPFGDVAGGNRIRPLAFWREVFCLRRNLKKQKNCPSRSKLARFDSLAHHPIGISSKGRPLPPRRRTAARDDLVIANMGALRRTLRAAERRKTTGNRGRHGIWAPEIWWQSKPRKQGVSLQKQADFMSEGLYLLWKQGVSGASFLQIVDSPHVPDQSPFHNYQTGVFTADNKRKPSHQAVRFPFVTDRRSANQLLAWGKAPIGGRVAVELRRGKRWKRVARQRVRAGRVFTARVRLPKGKHQLRARIGNETSRVWRQR